MKSGGEKCGAKTRSGGRCKRPAGFKTDHVGEGKCNLHGGATPIKHGANSKVQRARLREKIDKFLAHPDPLDLLPEVAMLRAFAEDLMERWESIYGPDGALLAWHESFKRGDAEPKPRQMPDFSAVSQVVDRVGAMVDRIQKHRRESSISLATMNRVVEQLGAELVYACQEVRLDADSNTRLLAAVERRWGAVRLQPDGAGAARDSEGAGGEG
jgi:hypothetical protein